MSLSGKTRGLMCLVSMFLLQWKEDTWTGTIDYNWYSIYMWCWNSSLNLSTMHLVLPQQEYLYIGECSVLLYISSTAVYRRVCVCECKQWGICRRMCITFELVPCRSVGGLPGYGAKTVSMNLLSSSNCSELFIHNESSGVQEAVGQSFVIKQ